MTHFSDLGLADPLLKTLSSLGYTSPTPIQAAAIPAVLRGRDLLGIAQTGTGKTAAFLLPLINRLAEDQGRAAPKTCRALVLAPTRELAAQIAENVRLYTRPSRLTSAVLVGGARLGPQTRALAGGIDILIATPGRLEDHMRSGAVRLEAVQAAVLDEADQMLDLGFLPAMRRVLAACPRGRQTLLFSATMPEALRKLAGAFLTDPEEISVAPAARPIERIAQSVRHVPSADKRKVLTDLLNGLPGERTIVFTRTKRGADRVTEHLQKAGLGAVAIHGNKSQGQRTAALKRFKGGMLNVLVATDIAARGIDIDDVSHVINYELPEVAEAYVHRIGRTARAGRSGTAIALCDPSERKHLRNIERLTGMALTAAGPDGAGDAAEQPERAQARPRADRPSGRRADKPKGRQPAHAAPKAAGKGRNLQRPAAKKAAGAVQKSRRNGPAHKRREARRPAHEADHAGLDRMLNNI